MNVEMKVFEHCKGVPARATSGSAAVDLRAAINEPACLSHGSTLVVPCGIAIHVGDPGLCAMILPRSGLGTRGIVLANTIGLIDSDYQGEIKVALLNRSGEPFTINPSDRIAQMVFVPVVLPALLEVAEFSSGTRRGAGGFGSTGSG